MYSGGKFFIVMQMFLQLFLDVYSISCNFIAIVAAVSQIWTEHMGTTFEELMELLIFIYAQNSQVLAILRVWKFKLNNSRW